MKFLAVLGCGAVCAAIGLFLAGWIASLCVRWYHVSGFEGGSGYYVVFLALGGGIAGLVAGLAISGIAIANGSGVGKAAAISAGSVAGVALLALALCWLFGDVPPKLRGDKVMVLLEFRAPEGWRPPVAVVRSYNYVTFRPVNSISATGHQSFAYVEWEDIPKDEGRIQIPVALSLFRSSAKWRAELLLEAKVRASVLLALPRGFREDQESWSPWQPAEAVAGEANGFEWRYRLQRNEDWWPQHQAEQDAGREAARKRFEALSETSPMRDWLEFRQPWDGHATSSTYEMHGKAGRVMQQRSEELAALLGDPDPRVAAEALEALARLERVPASAAPALRQVAAQLVDSVTAIADSAEDDGALYAKAAEVYQRFQQWSASWMLLANLEEQKSPPELAELIAAASRRTSLTDLSAMAMAGKDYQERWSSSGQVTNAE